MRIDRCNVKPVVENGLGFQCEGKTIEPETGQPSGFLKTRIALRILRIDEIKVSVRPTFVEHLASLKRALKLYLADVFRPDFEMESAQVLAQFSFRFGGNFKKR